MAQIKVFQQHWAFSSSLDTPLQNQSNHVMERRRVERILKLMLLSCERVVLSDSQLIDNVGIMSLLQHPEAREFFYASDNMGTDRLRPIVVSMRSNVGDFEEVLAEMIKYKALFSSLPMDEQQQLYGNERLKTPAHLYAFAEQKGLDFKGHIKRLNLTFKDIGPGGMARDSYPKLVYKQMNDLWPWMAFKNMSPTLADTLRQGILETIENSPPRDPPTRTTLFRVLKKLHPDFPDTARTPAPVLLKGFRELFLDFPYNLNFAISHGVGFATHGERRWRLIKRLAPELAKKSGTVLYRDPPTPFSELGNGRLILDNVTWGVIADIREAKLKEKLDAVLTAKDSAAIKKATKEHWGYVVETLRLRLPAELVWKPAISPAWVAAGHLATGALSGLAGITAVHYQDATLGILLPGVVVTMGELLIYAVDKLRTYTKEFKQFVSSSGSFQPRIVDSCTLDS